MNEKIELLVKFKGLIYIIAATICLIILSDYYQIPHYEFPDTNTICNKNTGSILYFDTFSGHWKYK